MRYAGWAALDGDPAAREELELTDAGSWLGGPLPVDKLAVGAVGTALLAAAELASARTGRRPAVALSAEHASLSFASERHARLHGEPLGAPFAPLSRFVCCAAGGWARTHGNYTTTRSRWRERSGSARRSVDRMPSPRWSAQRHRWRRPHWKMRWLSLGPRRFGGDPPAWT